MLECGDGAGEVVHQRKTARAVPEIPANRRAQRIAVLHDEVDDALEAIAPHVGADGTLAARAAF